LCEAQVPHIPENSLRGRIGPLATVTATAFPAGINAAAAWDRHLIRTSFVLVPYHYLVLIMVVQENVVSQWV
jgi:hypothetical protein